MAMTDLLNVDQRRSLELLADAGPNGFVKPILLMQGVTPSVLEALVRDGLATARPEAVRAGRADRQPIEVTRFRITDAGRRALAE
jgi:hypothetical protein